MNRILLIIYCLLWASTSTVLAQEFPLNKEANYWKNKMPHAGYWQQDVHYKMDVRIDEKHHFLSGHQQLRYWNNSPDTLHFVYFHLFQNAFIKGAYTHMLQEANHVKPRLGIYEKNGLGNEIKDIKVNGKDARIELDQTILKVYLDQPLLPNSSTVIDMDFATYWDTGSTRRRMKMYDAWGFMHYNGCQWFPKLAVYDAKFGWDTYQHLGKEFYGDFGVFDVTLDFPSNYIVEATGNLENRNVVLPADLRKKLDLYNFADKPWNEAPSTIIPYKEGERKKWHFVANNVHDFAFTADPSYRIATTYWNGVECVGLVQEPHASGWKGSEQLVAAIIKNFSNKYGTYYYPKMIAADAADGMEYPMLTLDGGRNPGYRGLLVHEIGHNWYYGMIGSNETYRAGMDEGFTQYITAEGLRMIDGDTLKEGKPKGWRAKHHEPKHPSDVRVLYPYVYNTTIGGDHNLNTHSDDFNGALHHGGGYSNVYYKSASMLYSMRVVLGDSLFDAAMLHYFHQWKFAHPYFEDFRNSIIRFTKVDLNWFFDQWWETTKPLDYGVQKIKAIKGTDSVAITFKRMEKSMQMPIDFVVRDKNGTATAYHIPNNWFTKPTDAAVLPKWIGWGKVQPLYTAKIYAPNGVKHVAIDTTYMMADRFMLNNSKTKGALLGYGKIKGKLDIGNASFNDRKKYRLYYRPDVWYNGIDGIKLGATAEGAYLHHILKFKASVWYNTTIGRWYAYLPEWNENLYSKYAPVNYSVALSSPFSLHYSNLKWNFASRFIDGIWKYQLGIDWNINSKHSFSAQVRSIYAQNEFATNYLWYGREWSSFKDNKNNHIRLGYRLAHQGFKHIGTLNVVFHAPMFTSNYDYNYLEVTHKQVNRIDKMLLRTRIFASKGWGQNLPYESSLFLAMAAPDEMIDNKYTRTQMIAPHDWQGFNTLNTSHLHAGGGMNLRGYAGYFAYDQRDGGNLLAYKSRSGVAINAELEFSNYIKFAPKPFKNWLKLQTYLFADAGVVELMNWQNEFEQVIPTQKWSDVRMDAGIGAALTITRWGKFSNASPLTIRADFPLFLNRPVFDQQKYFDFRWILGVGMSF